MPQQERPVRYVGDALARNSCYQLSADCSLLSVSRYFGKTMVPASLISMRSLVRSQ